MLGLASCQTDVVDGLKVDTNGEAPVTIQVALPADATRTAGTDSALGAIDNGFDTDAYDIRFILEVYDANGTLAKDRQVVAGDDTSATFEFRLVPGRDYTFVAWADFVLNGTKDDLHYNTNFNNGGLTNVELASTEQKLNDESRDAYTKVVTVERFSKGSQIPEMTLTRPFAKLRVVTTDMKELYSALTEAKVNYTSKLYTSFNALTATPGDLTAVGEKTIAYSEDNAYSNEQPDADGKMTKMTLFADYFFGSEDDAVKFTLDLKDGTTENIPQIVFNTEIPVQRNHLTTVMGPILTDANSVTVTIDNDFEAPEFEYYIEEDPATATITAVAVSANGLATIAEKINEGELEANTNIALAGDIDLNDFDFFTRTVTSNWTPIGTSENPFTGNFDGRGYTITNLALVESEAKEGKAYIGFFGYAKDATIKDVTFENVYINIPCLDIDHSQGHIGAVAGSLEGTSTIENVTVKGDITVYATQTANGASRVAVVAGGNSFGNVTMKNVHVIANEGSSLIANNNTGALAGQLQGKMVFENCSSNINVTVNKFFAGGLVGIAAGDSYFKNCHTTGDVAVVAGREGRHNDEYRVGGIAGGWADGKTKVCTLENCSYTGNVSGKNADGTVAKPLDYAGYVGRGYTLTNCAGSKVVIDGVAYIQKYDNIYGVYVDENGYDYIADGLCQNDKEYIVLNANGLVALANQGLKAGDKVLLGADIDLAGVEFNGLNTFHPENNNTFDGQDYTVSNWTNNSGASDMGFIRNWVGTIKNVKFENCHLKTSGRSAIAAAKVYGNIENVTINNCSLEDSYWACGLVAGLYNAGNISGCTVTNSSIKSNGGTGAIVGVINESAGTRKVENCKVEGCTVNNTGAYGETYSGALICGMINISDSTVEFNGCSFANNSKEGKYVGDLYYSADEDVTVTIDGKSVVKISTVEELNALKATNAYVMLCADLDFQGAAMAKPIELWKDSTFDGMGHKISNVTTAVQGGYATSLFRGDANSGNKVVKNLVVENLTTPAGYSYAAAIWSDLQSANIEIDNVHVNNATIAANGTIGGFVGFVSAGSTSVVVKNSTINNSNLNGGEADHKRGAVVGRAYGCVVNCENVVVENVKINDVAATEATLVGDKGYTGTVTVK